MTSENDHLDYVALQQVSFELVHLIGSEPAAALRARLIEALHCEEGQPSPGQILDALEIVQDCTTVRERVKELSESWTRTKGTFTGLPGDALPDERPPAPGRWITCPKCNLPRWDVPLSPDEKYLCLKHGVFFVVTDPPKGDGNA